ncbi:PKD domain-containing protein, partial [Lentimicrobium sp. S6]|uniref:PKD domain-containing protein n=1 Tax=Lentimicrobium sp. S6 TaxID=2735872 RepID=UPI001555722F
MVTFNDGAPHYVESTGMYANLGATSVSDNNGNLMFYATGQNVWNKNHVRMENGEWMGGDAHTIVSAISIPYPDQEGKYILFINTNSVNPTKKSLGLSYSIIDMNLNAGLGKVLSKQNDLNTNSSIRCAVIKHKNNKDYWLTYVERYSNTHKTHLINEDGISINPITQNIGYYHPDNPWIANAFMKFSPDGKTFALLHNSPGNLLELYHFDNATGLFSDLLTIDNFDHPTSVEFSPNMQKLYVGQGLSDGDGSIFQLDISNWNETAIKNSKELITTTPNYLGSMQVGPDHKIYISIYDHLHLAVINQPNLDAASCDFILNAVSLNGRNPKYSLPIYNPSYLFAADFNFENGCAGTPIVFTLTNSEYITSVNWDFGDGESSTELQPSHTFTSPGTYDVQVEVTNNGTVYTDTRSIEIGSGISFTITPSSLECEGEDMQLSAPTGYSSYEWSNGGSSATTTVNSSGTYTCSINDNGGCISTESYDLTMNQPDNVTFQNPNAVCSGETAVELNGGLPTGGVYSGSHVSAGYFNAQAAGIG